ncbi:MAG TPA: HEAT repeat domain-containing protein [Candidatus Obscuribacterales bacterium]
MGLILGIIIGLVVGAGLVYLWLKAQLDRKTKELQQSHRVLEEVSREQEARRQDLVRSLQADYQKQLDAQTQTLTQSHQAKVNALAVESQKQRDDQIQALTQAHDAKVRSLEAEIAHLTAQLEVTLPAPPTTLAPPEAPPEAIANGDNGDSPPPELANPPVDRVPTTPPVSPAVDLQQRLVALGQSGQLANSSSIACHASSPDPAIREQVAVSLGQLVASRMVGTDVRRIIPVLDRLSRDARFQVRCAAVESLGQIRSEQVIPILERSRRDAHPQVVKAASWAIAKFKFFRQTPPPSPPPAPDQP